LLNWAFTVLIFSRNAVLIAVSFVVSALFFEQEIQHRDAAIKRLPIKYIRFIDILF